MYPEENKPKILLIILGVALGAILGSFVTAAYFKNETKKLKTELNQAQQTPGRLNNPANLALPDITQIPIPDEITSISGSVEKIDGSTLTVKTNLFGTEKTYAAKVTDSTKIIKREISQIPPIPEEGKPFEPFTLTDVSLSDIRQNDNVTIEAGENIKEKTGFTAESVTIEIFTSLPDPLPAPDSNSVPTAPL